MTLMQNASYRSLELLCRNQAALSAHEETKKTLEQMACEYQVLAEDQERQQSLHQNAMRSRIDIDQTHSRAIIREIGKITRENGNANRPAPPIGRPVGSKDHASIRSTADYLSGRPASPRATRSAQLRNILEMPLSALKSAGS